MREGERFVHSVKTDNVPLLRASSSLVIFARLA
jgi:hypothetical protein